MTTTKYPSYCYSDVTYGRSGRRYSIMTYESNNRGSIESSLNDVQERPRRDSVAAHIYAPGIRVNPNIGWGSYNRLSQEMLMEDNYCDFGDFYMRPMDEQCSHLPAQDLQYWARRRENDDVYSREFDIAQVPPTIYPQSMYNQATECRPSYGYGTCIEVASDQKMQRKKQKAKAKDKLKVSFPLDAKGIFCKNYYVKFFLNRDAASDLLTKAQSVGKWLERYSLGLYVSDMNNISDTSDRLCIITASTKNAIKLAMAVITHITRRRVMLKRERLERLRQDIKNETRNKTGYTRSTMKFLFDQPQEHLETFRAKLEEVQQQIDESNKDNGDLTAVEQFLLCPGTLTDLSEIAQVLDAEMDRRSWREFNEQNVYDEHLRAFISEPCAGEMRIVGVVSAVKSNPKLSMIAIEMVLDAILNCQKPDPVTFLTF